jgi:hypothetical protein
MHFAFSLSVQRDIQIVTSISVPLKLYWWLLDITQAELAVGQDGKLLHRHAF